MSADQLPPSEKQEPSSSATNTKSSFAGLRVGSLESRRSVEIERMIERLNGVPHVSPSMRETATDDHRSAIEFAHRLLAGEVDFMLLLTGVGVRMFVEQVERHVGRQRLLDALSDIPTLARGPKPTAVLRELGIKPTLRAPAPNTWREVLATLDTQMPVANLTVGLQEYGETNPSLIAGLEARGATVDRVTVYGWELPNDCAPLEANARRIAAGELDVLLLTSAQQLNHLLEIGERLNLADELRAGFDKLIVASIGPTTSERLRSLNFSVDLEASAGTMGRLVDEAASKSHELLKRKAKVGHLITRMYESSEADKTMASDRQEELRQATQDEPWGDSDFLRACRQEPVRRTPIWLMRQAGRYMPEYRAVRSKIGFLELCKNPSLCSEVMCTAVDYLGVDAAIIFSDLLPILEPMGMDLEFAKGDGPVIHNPVRESEDVERVIDLQNIDSLHYVIETVSKTRKDLPEGLPLIGFAGAPFTLASYAIEGGGSKSYLHTKTLMHRDEGAWKALMQRLGRSVTLYLNAQIAAGAQAVQLFDSWVGCLGPDDYRRYVLPYTKELIDGLDPRAAVIHFGAGNPELLPLIAEAGGDVIGVDWRIRLADAWDRLGSHRSVQGNLDPLTLLADKATIESRADDLLKSVQGRAGHIFNLGHGIVPQTPPENARALINFVHEWQA